MRKLIFTGMAVAMLAVPTAAMAANPGGGTTKCQSDNFTAPVENNLVVPAGATCSLWGAQEIKGNVTVEAGATLESYQQTVFDGNVTVNGGNFRVLNRPVTIKKNLTITNSPSGVNGFWNVYDDRPSTIGGNFTYTNNAAPLYVGYNGAVVTGNFTSANNTSTESYLDALKARNIS